LKRLYTILAAIAASVPLAGQPNALPVSVMSRSLPDGNRSLLVYLEPSAASADELRIDLPDNVGDAVLMSAPGGWQLERDGRSIRVFGKTAQPPFRLRITLFSAPPLDRARVRVRSGNRDVLNGQVVVTALPALQTSATSAGFVEVPMVLTPGETIELTVLDPKTTPADGQWIVAGATAKPVGASKLSVQLPADLPAASPVRVAFFDVWGERIVDALTVDEVIVSDAQSAAPGRPRITGCARFGFIGQSVCVCGDFPEASWAGIRIDGQPAILRAASRHVVHLQLPDSITPGVHVVSGDPGSGFAAGETTPTTAVRVRGALDTAALLRGTSTTLRFALEGTPEPLTLSIMNKTPGIINIPGGNFQLLETSGGAVNGVERQVTGTAKGNASIDYKIDAPPCPCSEASRSDAPSAASRQQPMLVPRRVLATVAAGTPAVMTALAQAVALANGLAVIDVTPLAAAGVGMVVFEILDGIPPIAKAAALAADPRVTLAQPDFVYDTSQGTATPPLSYGPQMIGADVAHSVGRGDGIRVAVIDAGVDTGHAGLAANVAEYADVTGTGWTPDAHGTLVAGLIASEASGGVGGVAPRAQLVAVKSCVAQSSRRAAATCWSSTLARGIDLAAQKNVRVMNLSVGGPQDRLLARLVDAASRKGIAVVSAAGNDGPAGKPSYPAAFNDVIAVTAVDAAGRLYAQATRGSFIDLAAPGVDIMSTSPGGRTQLFSGTSAATAFASGAVALLLQQRSTLSQSELAALLRETAKDLGPGGRDAEFGDGLLDVCRAVARLSGRKVACR
jgi:hypothetical protein